MYRKNALVVIRLEAIADFVHVVQLCREPALGARAGGPSSSIKATLRDD